MEKNGPRGLLTTAPPLPRPAALLFLHYFVCARAAFNFTTCPAPHELQSPAVASSFRLSQFAGTYYELALHDYTQYPACPAPTCVRSVKAVDAARAKLRDAWVLSCFGAAYPEDLEFNLTSTPGFFLGTWGVLPGVVFPDTVVDVGPVLASGQYEWAIELQCVQVAHNGAASEEVVFVGINFYHTDPTPGAEALGAMLAAARARGLGVYMNHSFGVYTVPQGNCSWGGG